MFTKKQSNVRVPNDRYYESVDVYITNDELQKLLIQWGLPENEVDAYLITDDDDEKYSFDEFYQNMKPICDFAYENMVVSNDDQVVQPLHPHSN
ncbi:unnamed protein product [Adineta steineri]|uniref:Uncharacterized protein n=1 Tax=Adineta steineri TaxID=433720 RepID=A0A819IPY0_9BILA|nr:unnamed protein product [Adineta steineri]CAF3917465.1 unnamed protein product [Adineta steineri]